MNKQEAAEDFFKRALATEKERGGAPTSVTGLSEANLGLLAKNRNDTGTAEELLSAGLQNLSQTTSADDPRLVTIFEAYAAVLKTNHHFKEAEETEVKAMNIRVRSAIHSDASNGFLD